MSSKKGKGKQYRELSLAIDPLTLEKWLDALEGNARNQVDVGVFLQMSIIVVFVDSIVLFGFDSPDTRKRCQLAIDRWKDLGLPEGVISFTSETSDEVIELCDSAARVMSADPDLEILIEQPVLAMTPSISTDLGSGEEALVLAPAAPQPEALSTVCTLADAGAIPVFISGNDAPHGVITELVAKALEARGRIPARTDAFAVLADMRVREARAFKLGLVYAAALSRARVFGWPAHPLCGAMAVILGVQKNNVPSGPPDIPPLVHALVMLGKSEPKATAKKAVDLRKLMRPLRRRLARLGCGVAEVKDPTSLLRELEILREAFVLSKAEKRSGRWNVIEDHLMGIVQLMAKATKRDMRARWAGICRHRSTVAVLADMCREKTTQKQFYAAFIDLMRACGVPESCM